jgi:uncharacterized membrane protein (DUF4010 family)
MRLAPSWPEGFARGAMVVAVCTLVWLVTIKIVGWPSRERAIEEGGGGPYGPSPFGLVQFFGQGALLAAGVYVGRRWLRIKL